MPASQSTVSPWSRWFLVPVVFLAPLLAPPLLRAEEPSPPTRAPRNWSIELATGLLGGGPAEDIEDAMRAAGFDDYLGGGQGWGSTSHPFTSDADPSVWGAARRKLGDGRWQVGVGIGWTNFDSVFGNRNVEGDSPESVVIYSDIEMLTIAPMAWFQPVPAVRLGAGLAMDRVDTSIGYRYPETFSESSSWKPGLVVEAAVTVPVASRFYFLALLQYRWLQSGTIGPWQETASTGEVVVFPESEINLSHGFVALGVGIRF